MHKLPITEKTLYGTIEAHGLSVRSYTIYVVPNNAPSYMRLTSDNEAQPQYECPDEWTDADCVAQISADITRVRTSLQAGVL